MTPDRGIVDDIIVAAIPAVDIGLREAGPTRLRVIGKISPLREKSDSLKLKLRSIYQELSSPGLILYVLIESLI